MAQNLSRVLVSRLCAAFRFANTITPGPVISCARGFSASSGGGGGGGGDGAGEDWGGSLGAGSGEDLGWDTVSSWSTGVTKGHFDGEVVEQRKTAPAPGTGRNPYENKMISDVDLDEFYRTMEADIEEENRKSKAYVDSWPDRFNDVTLLLKQVSHSGRSIFRLHELFYLYFSLSCNIVK